MANVSLKHIYKVYSNGTKAVNDFNMEIQDKEFIVFVGPSGCGKSTTLRMIAGLEDISAGELKIGDMIVNDVEPKDRDIAMVFQNYALYPHMTVYENIAFGLRLKKLPKDEIHSKVVEAANILGITEYLDKKPKEMSGGQRQRVALGRAIVREPKVMLLDEPLSNLDAKLRTQMRAEITKLHNKLQTTFIYVTHDQVEAMTMGTRIVVMKDGFVQQIDTPKNLYKYPCNKFVASFIGTPQMNFFEGTLSKSGDNAVISFSSGVSVTVPFSMLYKVKPNYLDGKTKVYIGFRPEDLSASETDVKKSKAVIKVKVSHKEDLGNETLVYGDMNLDVDGLGESTSKIIVKYNGERDLQAGEIIDVALNVDRIHLFDGQTEQSILPRIPEYNYLDCEVKGGKLCVLGAELDQPQAVQCGDVKGQLLLPADAVTFGGALKAQVVSCENINGVNLVALTVNNQRLYAVSQEAVSKKTVNIGVDFKKITILSDGENKVSPLQTDNSFDCQFIKKKTAEEGSKKKVLRFGFKAGDAFFEASEDFAQKIFAALGIKKAFTTPLKMQCDAYSLRISDSGIKAVAECVLDYGAEKFLQCRAGGNTVIVRCDGEYSGEVFLMPDFDKTGVVETERQIKII